MEVQSIKSKIEGLEAVEYGIRCDLGVCKDLYHGTTKNIAYQIIKSGRIECGNTSSYLGCGIYCYLHDINACKIWVKNKYKNEPVTVFKLIANLGNVLFVDTELYKFLRETLRKIGKTSGSDINDDIGILIEEIIEDYIITEYEKDIHAVSRAYIIGKSTIRRPAIMYCLRYENRIKKFNIEPEV